MLSIGDFARLGRVSPRMLRHYDELGLWRPDRVDPTTGYRSATNSRCADCDHGAAAGNRAPPSRRPLA